MTYEEMLAWAQARGLLEPMMATCLRHHVTLDEMHSRARGAQIPRMVLARSELFAMLARRGISYSEIGHAFGRESQNISRAVRETCGFRTRARPGQEQQPPAPVVRWDARGPLRVAPPTPAQIAAAKARLAAEQDEGDDEEIAS